MSDLICYRCRKWPCVCADGITLVHGDCREVLLDLRGKNISAVITDPPYAFSTSSSGTKHSMWADCINSASWFAEMLREFSAIVGRGPIWQFTNWRTIATLQKASHDAKLPLTSIAVWDKDWIGPGGDAGLRPSYEMVALWCVGGFKIKERGIPDILKHPWSSFKPNGHPAEKPEPLLSQLISISESGYTLDPFCGSGTTLVAAKNRGQRAIGIELEQEWCEVAANRLRQEVLPI